MKQSLLVLAFAFLSFTTAFAQNAKVEGLIDKGIELNDAGKYTEAIAMYKQALDIDNNSVRACYETGNTYIQMQDYKKAIYYADKVISAGKDFVDQAYSLKGNALDMMGNGDEAIEVYKEGIKSYPDDYLLHYNLAFTRMNKGQYDLAEKAAIKSLGINPMHASTHMLLAVCKMQQSERVPAMLALYFFLWREQQASQRAVNMMSALDKLKKSGVSQEGNKVNIEFNPGKRDEWSSIDLMISLSQAAKAEEKNKKKTEMEGFVDDAKTLFEIAGESKKDNTGFFWDFYVPFYAALSKTEHMEAFCYEVCKSKQDAAIQTWLGKNKIKVDAMNKWCSDYFKKEGVN